MKQKRRTKCRKQNGEEKVGVGRKLRKNKNSWLKEVIVMKLQTSLQSEKKEANMSCTLYRIQVNYEDKINRIPIDSWLGALRLCDKSQAFG